WSTRCGPWRRAAHKGVVSGMDDVQQEKLFYQVMRMVAPGTQMYDALEMILRARTGALIVVGDTQEVLDLVNGGFKIDAEMHPAALYELAKMDGAIIMSTDARSEEHTSELQSRENL